MSHTEPELKDPGPPPSDPGNSWGKPARKAAVLLSVLLGFLLVAHYTPLKSILSRTGDIDTALQKLGLVAPLVYVAGVATLVAVGCPRLLLCPIGGVAFGFWPGLLWSQLGTVLGFSAVFLFVRRGGHDWIVHRYPKVAAASAVFKQAGVPMVIMARQLPVAGFFVSALLALTPIKFRDFLLGTLIGMLPEAIPATLVGSSARSLSMRQGILWSCLAIFFLVVAWGVCSWYVRTRKPDALRSVRRALRGMNDTDPTET